MTKGDITIINNHRVMMILEKFSLDDAGEVEISLYDWENDKAVEKEYRFSNIKKMIDELNANNIKCVDGEVTDQEGKPVWVDNAKKLENKTLKEVRAGIDATKLGGKNPEYYRYAFNRIKMLVDTEETSAPAQWMAGVTWENELVFWGYNHASYFINGMGTDNAGVQTIPQSVEKHGVEIKKLYANTWNLFVLYEDGDLYVMGYNGYGQLGVGNTAIQYKLVKSAENVTKLSTSSVGYHQDYNHVMILKEDGSAWLTGHNGAGQLGNGNTTSQNSWVKADILEKAKDILAVGTNNATSYILTEDGTVYATGYNGHGQLGDGSVTNSSGFKKINNISDYKVVKIVGAGGTRYSSSAYYHNFILFLTDAGRVFTLGYNGYGQLGVNNTEHQRLPIEISYGHENNNDPVKDIFTSKASMGSSGYITESGRLYMTGYNAYGELGVGDTTNRLVPTFVMNDVSYVQSVASGTYGYHRTYIARKLDGTLFAWGYNGNGQVGDNTTTNATTPKQIPFDNADKVVQISQGGYSSSTHFNVLLSDGRVYGWGANEYQQSYPQNGSANVRRPIRTI